MGDGTLSDALRRRAHTLRTRASEPSGIRLADKLLFCAGVTFIPVTEWVMIVHPYRFSYGYCPHASAQSLTTTVAACGRRSALDVRPCMRARCTAYTAGTRRRSCCC